jgi:2-dehydropantoate 2-reductase
VAAVLCRKGLPVTCIGLESEVAVLLNDGLRVESQGLGSFTARPEATARLEHAVDVLFVTTKATSLQEALARVPAGRIDGAVIVPLLNGIDHLETLRVRYGERVAYAVIGDVEIKRPAPAQIIHSSPGATLWIATGDGEFANLAGEDALSRVSDLFADTVIDVVAVDDGKAVMWGKLIRLNAIACMTSLTQQPVGKVRENPEQRTLLAGCVRDAVAVAAADGYRTTVKMVMSQIDSLPAGLGTSMQRDIAAGRPSELGAIAGGIVRRGRDLGVACPAIEDVINRISKNVNTGN